MKSIPVLFRTLIVFICVLSVLTVGIFSLVNSSNTDAAENDAINGTASAIQAAIDDLGGNPGTIYISEGEWSWSSTDSVTLTEGAVLIGAGVENTIINVTRTTSTQNNGVFYIPGGADDCRMSNFRINTPDGTPGIAIRIGDYGYTTNDYIIDNMEFHGFGAYEGAIKIRAAGRGLICDSTFYGYTDGTWGYGIVYYGANVYTTDNSAYLGTAKNLFIERCTFYRCKHAISSDMGAHYVFRYNTIKENQYYGPIDAHGGLASNQQGTNSIEVYNNSISDPISESGHACGIRGGQSYIFNNKVSGYNYAVGYRLESTNDPTYIVHDSYEWNNSADYGTSYVMNLYGSRSYIFEGTHYYANTKPDGYTPYVYPHPLTPGSSTPTNSAPTVKNDSYEIYQDTELVIGNPGVLNNDSDPEGDALSAVLVSDPSHGSLTLNPDGSFNYTPDSGFSGSDSFSYKASDGTRSSNTATVTITVGSEVTPPATGIFGLDSGNLTWIQPGNSLQAMRFRNTAGEGTLDSLSILFDDTTPNGKVRMGVYADDSGAPGVLLLDAGEATVQDGWVSITGLNLQVEQDDYYWLSYFLQEPNGVRYQSNQPAGSHYQINPCAYGAMPGQYPSGSFINNNQYVLRATVNNNPLVTIDDSYTTDQDTELVIGNPGVLDNDSDPEGDVLSAVLASGTSHGTLTLNADGSFTYTPDSGFSGTDSFSYTASDGTNSSKTATVTITIIAKDNPPIAGDDSYIMEQDSELIIGNPGVLINDSDLEGDVLSAVLDSSASHGTLILHADGSFNYTPASGFIGTDSFSYKASDGINPSNTANVTITVIAKADPPIAGNDSYIMEQDSELVIGSNHGVLINDSDPEGDVLNTVLVTSVSHGSLILHADGSFNYTPASGFSGTDSFSYKASDGIVSSNTATVTINVSPMNMPDTIYSVITELVHLS